MLPWIQGWNKFCAPNPPHANLLKIFPDPSAGQRTVALLTGSEDAESGKHPGSIMQSQERTYNQSQNTHSYIQWSGRSSKLLKSKRSRSESYFNSRSGREIYLESYGPLKLQNLLQLTNTRSFSTFFSSSATMSTNSSSQPSQAEMGAALSAAAYAQPPIKPHGLALRLIIVIWILTAIATIVIGLRIYVRAWMLRKAKLWGWEDTFAVLGYVSFEVSSS